MRTSFSLWIFFPCNILSRSEKIFCYNLDVVLFFFYKILNITHMMHRHEQRKIIFPNSTLFWSLSIPIWVVIDAFWYFFTRGGIYLVNKKISLTSGLATLTLGGYPSSIKLCFWYINAFYKYLVDTWTIYIYTSHLNYVLAICTHFLHIRCRMNHCYKDDNNVFMVINLLTHGIVQ